MTILSRLQGLLVGGTVLVLAALPVTVHAQGTLFVEGDQVGIGIATPQFDLHVVGTDGATQFRVAEQSSTAAARNMFTLENNGGVKFSLFNGLNNSTWQFTAQANFNIDLVGQGGNELQLQSDGDLVIQGVLTENSSRTVKTDFGTVDSREVLRKLVELPISSWQYVHDLQGSRHLGPMAEDFHAAFGLGEDALHISPGDKAGVALAAIQGLARELGRRDAEIARLTAEREELEARFAALEAAVAELRQ